MGALKVSQFTPAGALADTDLFGFVQGITNVKEQLSVIASFILAKTLADAGTAELIRDTIGAALVAGSNISITVDDAGNTITVAGTTSLTVEADASAAYGFVLADAGKHKRFTFAGAVTATVPTNATQAFPVGTRIRITDASTGLVTLAPAVGVTLNSRDNALKSAGQFAVFEIEKVGANEWDVLGDLVV